MKKKFLIFKMVILTCMILLSGCTKENNSSKISSFKQVKNLFENPPVEYRSAPLWVWNDDVTEEEIDRQLKELKAGGMGGVFIHPRPGLITSYLSDRWFELCRYTVDKSKEMGMQVWLYDENSYPSGFAGGHVPAEMPESYNQGQGLVMSQVDKLPDELSEKFYLVLKKERSKFIDITEKFDQEKNKKGDYYLFRKSYYGKSGWHGGFSYVDLLLDGVTEKFIELTMDGYEKAIGDEFGKLVPGIFTDEPNIHSPAGIKWTPALFEKYEERWGYDLKINLPSLFLETGDWKTVRHNYYLILTEMFIDRWCKPWYNYCEEKNLVWTGHYWEHGWPNPAHGGDNMAMYAWHQMPAIDILMNQYSESVNAQFGNVRAVKELSSVANQMGRTRTLSETYGAGGWDLTFEDMKRIGDWQYVLGVNFLNQHLSYITIKGARKRDHPQSFSYHASWWDNYYALGDYFARLSLALSSGQQINKILVIEPTSTSWMYYSPKTSNDKFSDLGPAFQKFVVKLEKYQVEYDLGSENIVKNNGKIEGGRFVIGERKYDLVVFPPNLENLDSSTFDLVKQYLKNGGKILSVNSDLKFINGSEEEKIKSVTKKYSDQWKFADSMSGEDILTSLKSNEIKFIDPEKITGKLFHHRRTLDDGELLFLANTSLEEWSAGTFALKGKSVNELNLLNGSIVPYPFKIKDKSVVVDFDLPPAGSLLLNINDISQTTNVETKTSEVKIVSSSDKITINRMAPNVLTIDYCDLKIKGEKEDDLYFFKAADKIFREHNFDGNPWSRAVQYKTSIIDRNNLPDGSGFEATYNFIVEPGIEKKSFRAVVEQPELWKLSINGTIVKPNPKESWLDRAFGVFNIGDYVVDGKNEVSLNASPMTVYSELEAIYILGEFHLAPADKGWKLTQNKPLHLGNWKKQGLPFYSDAISYSKTYQLQPGDKRYIINAPFWEGSTIEVKVNNKKAGLIGWQPNEMDITDFIKDGENEISLLVYGTPRNLLGPHHNGPVRGTAWPAMFESAPPHQPTGREYDFIGYGLFEDFTIIEYNGKPKRFYRKFQQVVRPEIFPNGRVFAQKPIAVTLSTKTEGAEIYFTLDGKKPDETSTRYSTPIKLKKNTLIKAIALKDGLVNSKEVERSFNFVKKNNGVNYRYFESNWADIPDFKKLKPKSQGTVFEFDLDALNRRKASFAVEFTSKIKIEKTGNYTFYTESNDGSKLFINGVEVVNNGGSHGKQLRRGKIKLASGKHDIKVLYFDAGGSQFLEVSFEGPGIRRQIIPASVLLKN